MEAAVAPTTAAALETSPVLCTRTLAAVEAVFDPHVHLVVWQRAGDAGVAQRADCWPLATGRLMRSIVVRDLDVPAVASMLSLPPHSPFAADVLLLAELFATVCMVVFAMSSCWWAVQARRRRHDRERAT